MARGRAAATGAPVAVAGEISKDQRRKIMDQTIAAIQKNLPDNIFGRYSEIGKEVDIQVISTGSLAVDAAIGGGFPKHRITEIVGHTSSGKTTLALTCCANMQKENPDANIMYVDAEQALDPYYAECLGVNLNDLIICQPGSGEEGFEAAEMFISSGVADLLIIDSIAAMLPKSIIERSYSQESQPGQMAKLISTAIGRINRLANQKKCTVILINQWKPVVKINQYAAVSGAMGNWYQPGGAQLPFFCSQIIEIKKSGEIKVGAEVKSSVTTMTCKKNKIAPPYKTADFVITYGKGLDREQELIGLGLSTGLIKQAGSFYSFPEFEAYAKTYQGRGKLGDALTEDRDLADLLEKHIKEQIKEARTISIAKDALEEEDPSDTVDDGIDLMDDAVDVDNF